LKRFFEVLFWTVVGLVGIPIFGILVYTVFPKDPAVERQVTGDNDIVVSELDDISPEGELPKIFSFFSDATEMQRSEKERQIKGKVVQWRLPVYNVSERGGVYVVQTKSRANLVGAFCYVRPSNDGLKQYLLSLKENDYVTCKGKIAGSTMRSIEIKPAVLLR
jgi:hypothetical protein